VKGYLCFSTRPCRVVKKKINELLTLVRTNDSFVQNSAYMFSASSWTILIQFIFFPILSRIYDPAAYGTFAIFNTWVVVLGTLATLSYNKAFVLPKEDSVFKALLKITLRFSVIISLGVIAVTLVLGEEINTWTEAEELGKWVYLIGPAVLLYALDRIVIDWSIRVRAFKKQSLFSIPTTLGAKLFNVGYGKFISPGPEGLILTMLVHFVVRIYWFTWHIISGSFATLKERIPKVEIRAAAKEYNTFPKFILWGNVLNLASSYLPVIILPIVMNSSDPAGYFTIALVALDLPVRLLGSGISPVFLQKAADIQNRDPASLPYTTWKLYRYLVLLSLVPFLVLYTWGTPLYEIAFGDQWELAGRAAELLVVYYFFRLTSTPISSIFNVLRKEKQLLVFQAGLFAIRALSLLVGAMFTTDFLELILIFSLANAVVYLILNIWIFYLLKQYALRVALTTLAYFGATLLLGELLKTI
jgi:O-antigen/teichoic acid export membrane protein